MEVFKVSQELAGASCEFVAATRSMMHDAFRHLGTSRGSSQIFAYKRTKYEKSRVILNGIKKSTERPLFF